MIFKSSTAIAATLSFFFAFMAVVAVASEQETTQMSNQLQKVSKQKPVVEQWTKKTGIGQIVADRPQTARIFELVEIDYCCGGRTSLGDAAVEKNMNVERLLAALLAVGVSTQGEEQRNWQQAELGELMDHIVARHHSWLRRELPPLIETTGTVHRVHGANHPELKQIDEIVQLLPDAILPHLDYEEKSVFPALRKLASGDPPGNITALLEEMKTDHDELGTQLHELRKLTDGFAVPADACAKYKQMLTGLESLERDLHIHVHLENNVLLPRALKLLESNR